MEGPVYYLAAGCVVVLAAFGGFAVFQFNRVFARLTNLEVRISNLGGRLDAFTDTFRRLASSDEVKMMVTGLRAEVGECRVRLEEMRASISPPVSSIQPEPEASSAGLPPGRVSADEGFIIMYNEAVGSATAAGAFRDRYLLERIGVTNAMERRQDPRIQPLVESAEDGNYFAVRREGADAGRFWVIPRFDLTIDDAVYGPGGLELFFECAGYESGCRHRDYRLVKPALFRCEGARSWHLVDRGSLRLERMNA